MIQNLIGQVTQQRGWTIQQLADHAQIAPNTARALYKGHAERISFDVLDRVCRALQVQPGDLLVCVEPEASASVNGAVPERTAVAPPAPALAAPPAAPAAPVARTRKPSTARRR